MTPDRATANRERLAELMRQRTRVLNGLPASPPPEPVRKPPSAATLRRVLREHSGVLHTLIFLNRRLDMREVAQAEMIAKGGRPTHVIGEVFGHAMRWVHSQCEWPGNRNGAELWEFVAQITHMRFCDPVAQEIVIPRLRELDAKDGGRRLWIEVLGAFPALAAEVAPVKARKATRSRKVAKRSGRKRDGIGANPKR